MDLHAAVNNKFGYEMKYMRPPKGEFSERTLSLTDGLGFKTVMWSFAYVDWNEPEQEIPHIVISDTVFPVVFTPCLLNKHRITLLHNSTCKSHESIILVRVMGLEPTHRLTLEPKSNTSTISAKPAFKRDPSHLRSP